MVTADEAPRAVRRRGAVGAAIGANAVAVATHAKPATCSAAPRQRWPSHSKRFSVSRALLPRPTHNGMKGGGHRPSPSKALAIRNRGAAVAMRVRAP